MESPYGHTDVVEVPNAYTTETDYFINQQVQQPVSIQAPINSTSVSVNTQNGTFEMGTWVWVPVNVDAPAVAEAVHTNSGWKTRGSGVVGYIKNRLRSAKDRRVAGLQARASSLASRIIPGVNEGTIDAAVVAVKKAAQRPEAMVLMCIGGAGLVCLAARSVMTGSLVYFCFTPHFHFNNYGPVVQDDAAQGHCPHCQSCQTCEEVDAEDGEEDADTTSPSAPLMIDAAHSSNEFANAAREARSEKR